MNITIREMSIQDYPSVFALWKSTPGVGVGDADTEEFIRRFLERNPGISYVAVDGENLIGASMCGHDGRRGFIHHLSIEKEYRGRGIGRSLVEKCLEKLSSIGIYKCHILIFRDNVEGKEFWKKMGWSERENLAIMTRKIDS